MELYEGIFHEIDDFKLMKLLQDKSKESKKSVKDVIWMYINRGILEDDFSDEVLFKFHSEEFMRKVDKILGLD